MWYVVLLLPFVGGVVVHPSTAVTCGSTELYPSPTCGLRVSTLPGSSSGPSTLERWVSGGWEVVTAAWDISGTQTQVEYRDGINTINDTIVEIVLDLSFNCGHNRIVGLLIDTADPCAAVLSPGSMYLKDSTTFPYDTFWDAPTDIAVWEGGSPFITDVYTRHHANHGRVDGSPTILWYASTNNNMLGVELETSTRGSVARVHRSESTAPDRGTHSVSLYDSCYVNGADASTLVYENLAFHRLHFRSMAGGRPTSMPTSYLNVTRTSGVCGVLSPDACWSRWAPTLDAYTPLELEARMVYAPDAPHDRWLLLHDGISNKWPPFTPDVSLQLGSNGRGVRMPVRPIRDGIFPQVGGIGITALDDGSVVDCDTWDVLYSGPPGNESVAGVHQYGFDAVVVIYVTGLPGGWAPEGTTVIVSSTGVVEAIPYALSSTLQTSSAATGVSARISSTSRTVAICGSEGAYFGIVNSGVMGTITTYELGVCQGLSLVVDDAWNTYVNTETYRAAVSSGAITQTSVYVAMVESTGILTIEGDTLTEIGTHEHVPYWDNDGMTAWVSKDASTGLPVGTPVIGVCSTSGSFRVGTSNGTYFRWADPLWTDCVGLHRSVSSPLVFVQRHHNRTSVVDLSEGWCFGDVPAAHLPITYGAAQPSPLDVFTGCRVGTDNKKVSEHATLDTVVINTWVNASAAEPLTVVLDTNGHIHRYRHASDTTQWGEDYAERARHIIPMGASINDVFQGTSSDCNGYPGVWDSLRIYHAPEVFNAHYTLGTYTTGGTTSPTFVPTSVPSSTPTSAAPTAPTTATPSVRPTAAPTSTPTDPTDAPTSAPTSTPTGPTAAPTSAPTTATPSVRPTATPTASPTAPPTAPTASPTYIPTTSPTSVPTFSPTGWVRVQLTPCSKVEDEDITPTITSDRTCTPYTSIRRGPGILLNSVNYGLGHYYFDVSNSSLDAVVSPGSSINLTDVVCPTDTANVTMHQYHSFLSTNNSVSYLEDTHYHVPSVFSYQSGSTINKLRHRAVDVHPVSAVPRVYRVPRCGYVPYVVRVASGGMVHGYNPTVRCGRRTTLTTATSANMEAIRKLNSSIITHVGIQPGVLNKSWFGTVTSTPLHCPSNVFYTAPSGTCTPLTPCASGYEYETSPSGPFYDRECASLTSCGNTAYESTRPTVTTDRACTALTHCSASHYVAIGSTPTTDRGCALRTASCRHGFYYTVQADAAPGETAYSNACTACPSGMSSWTSTDWMYDMHTQTSCTWIEDLTSPCMSGVTYFSSKRHSLDVTQNITAACMLCTICGANLIEDVPCTLTSNTMCVLPTLGMPDVDDPPPTKCNEGFYLNSFNDINKCLACTICPGGTEIRACKTTGPDAACGPNSIVDVVYDLVLVLFVFATGVTVIQLLVIPAYRKPI
jgi:hypothetical protein